MGLDRGRTIFALSTGCLMKGCASVRPVFPILHWRGVFRHRFPHERSDLSHWRKRLGDKLERLLAESLRVAHDTGALRGKDLARLTVDTNAILSAVGHNFRRNLARLKIFLALVLAAIARALAGSISAQSGLLTDD
jgi:hypothetical protein